MTRARSRTFSPVAVLVAVMVAVVAFAGLTLVSAYAPELRSGNDGRAHALSNASTGFAGIRRLLGRTGAPVVMSRGRLGASADDSLLILTPPPGGDPERIASLDHAGPILIVLPKWRTAPDPGVQGWVRVIGMENGDAIVEPLRDRFAETPSLARAEGEASLTLRWPSGRRVGETVRIEALQTISGAGLAPVLTDAGGRAVLVRDVESWTYVLADPDLLNTQGLKTLAGARTATAVIDTVRVEDSPIVFDLTLHGFERQRNLLRLMLEPPLLGMTLVLVALAALAGWQTLIRFGPAREPPRVVAAGKQALADNTAALIRTARREHRMATPYARLLRAAAARAIGAPGSRRSPTCWNARSSPTNPHRSQGACGKPAIWPMRLPPARSGRPAGRVPTRSSGPC